MQRDFWQEGRGAKASRARENSRTMVVGSKAPPPPPPPLAPLPPLLEELELELELELPALEPGVMPEVTGAAQAVVPAVVGASLLADVLPTITSALSACPRLSVTVTRRVTVPTVGAMTVAELVFAPNRAGGFVVGAATVHW